MGRRGKRQRKAGRDGIFVLDIGDLHAFHKHGLVPPDFQSSTGATINLNSYQQYLWECWQHFLARSDLPNQIDVMTLGGDLGEGQNPAEEARDLSEVDPTFQARGIAHILAPLAQRVSTDSTGQRRIHAIQGSGYHVGKGAAIEEIACQMIGARKWPNGHYVQPWIDNLVIHGVLFDIAHNQSVVTRYRTMPLEREVGFWLEKIGRLMLKHQRDGLPFSQLIILRHHAHYGFRVVREENVTAISVPAWKLMDGYISRGKMVNRYVPENIGSVGIWMRGSKRAPRITIVPFLYDHPQKDWEVLEID